MTHHDNPELLSLSAKRRKGTPKPHEWLTIHQCGDLRQQQLIQVPEVQAWLPIFFLNRAEQVPLAYVFEPLTKLQLE